MLTFLINKDSNKQTNVSAAREEDEMRMGDGKGYKERQRGKLAKRGKVRETRAARNDVNQNGSDKNVRLSNSCLSYGRE